MAYANVLHPARPNGVVIRELVNTTYSGSDIKHSLTMIEGKSKVKMVETEEFIPKNAV